MQHDISKNVLHIDILLIEDNPGDAYLIQQMLSETQGLAFRLTWAESLTKGIDHLHTEHIDIVLLDLGLPESSGLETLQRLFAQAPHVPTLVVLSGLTDETIAFQAVQSGAQDYLVKGKVDSDLLVRSIRYAIERSQAEEALQRAHDELEQRVKERTAELAGAIEALHAEIAERKRAEESLRERNIMIRRLVESNIIGVFLWDIKGDIIDANDTFLQITGYSREDLGTDALKWTSMTPPEYREADKRAFEGLYMAGYYPSYEKEYIRKDGSRIPILIGASLIEESVGNGVAFVLDLSARKQADKERQARQVAEAASQAKSEFLANLSHELRSPLNAILGFARLVVRRPDLLREVREDIQIIVRSGEHLHTLINQVLDLSKIEAGRVSLNKTSFDLNGLLDEMEDMFSISSHDQGIQFVVKRAPNLMPYLYGDVVKLRQVLINLLNNAFKFTKKGYVRLDVEQNMLPDGNYDLIFSISDTGPGIEAEELAQLFDAFTQANAGRQSQEGTGLGLSISRSFIKLMEGNIQVDSQVGQGTTVSFDIPLQPVAASAIPIVDQAYRHVLALAPGQPRYRILVADDQRVARQLLIRLLSPLGFVVREASNGQEAMEIWKAWRPHLIWMDMRMPVLNGREATRRIRAEPDGKETVIIALTASSFKDERADILKAGCNDLLNKPFAETDFFDLMQKHLGVRFLCQEQQALPTLPPPPDEEALAALPTESARLEQAVTQLDAAAVDRTITIIRKRNSALADSLQPLADDYQYDRILQIIQHAYIQSGRNEHADGTHRQQEKQDTDR